MTDKKVRAKNNRKINILIVFIVFCFCFFLITSEPLGVSACSQPRKIEGDACDFQRPKTLKSVERQKSYSKKQSKNSTNFCFFGFFFHFVFSNNSQTLWCFQSLFAGPVAVHAGNLLQQRKLKSVEKQKSYKQKNKKKQSFLSFFLFFRFVFSL